MKYTHFYKTPNKHIKNRPQKRGLDSLPLAFYVGHTSVRIVRNSYEH